MKNKNILLPRFHIYPFKGRLNDPNGLIFFKKQYHIFYQNNPESTLRGKCYWGHYVTSDFIHYKHLPLALCPNSKIDKDGCYSGSSIRVNNKMYLFYTGNIKYKGDYDYIYKGRESNTIRAESKDGIRFTNKTVIFKNSDYPSNLSLHVRDPYVYKEKDNYYLTLGVRDLESHGGLLTYKSKDLVTFKLDKLNIYPDLGYMFECPCIFNLSNKKVYSFSPQGVKEEANRFKNIYSSGYCINKISKSNYNEWDLGYDFYVPQVFSDNKHRTILIAWAGIENPAIPYIETKEKWKHCLTLPRELKFKNNKIYQYPIKEILSLFTEFKDSNFMKGDQLVAKFNVKDLTMVNVSNSLLIRLTNKSMITSFPSKEGSRPERTYKININKMMVILDHSIVEIYINDGEYVFTSRVYSSSPSITITGSKAKIAKVKSISIR